MSAEVARPREEFLFLSQLLERSVLAQDGEPVGRLVEVGCGAGELFPKVLTYYVRPGWLASVTLAVPAPGFVTLPDTRLRLAVPTAELQPLARRLPEEILLRREILDKQIVDTDGARVVRVNDVHLLRARGNEVRVVHVDIGFRGIVRRLGFMGIWERLRRLRGTPEDTRDGERLLSWRYVVPLRSSSLRHDLRLNVTQHQLAQLHPAELAEIMEELDRFEGPAMLEALDVPTAALTLAELSGEAQRLLLEALDARRGAALLAAMAPDEATDILQELPEAMRERLMAALPADDAATVSDLLTHEKNSAGSAMNPEVFSVPLGARISEVSVALREGAADLVRTYAVMVVDNEQRLRGVVALPELIRASTERLVDEAMDADPVSVRTDDSLEDVAELFDRFNLLSLPVVDREGHLEGVVTVDDVVAWLREGREREGRLT